MLHSLKISRKYFEDVYNNDKKFEVRKKDRDYMIDDFLALNEYDADNKCYTGRTMLFSITYIFDDIEFCKDGFVIIAIEPCTIDKTDEAKCYVNIDREDWYNELKKLRALNEP